MSNGNGVVEDKTRRRWPKSDAGFRSLNMNLSCLNAPPLSLLPRFGRRLPGIFEKRLHVSAAKTFDSPDRVTGQLAPSDHAVDRHWRQLQQVSELADSIKLRLGVFVQS